MHGKLFKTHLNYGNQEALTFHIVVTQTTVPKGLNLIYELAKFIHLTVIAGYNLVCLFGFQKRQIMQDIC